MLDVKIVIISFLNHMNLLSTPYISSIPIKLGKNTPEMIKYAFNDISTSEQGIMIITLATWMQIQNKHCQILYNQDNMVNLKKSYQFAS